MKVHYIARLIGADTIQACPFCNSPLKYLFYFSDFKGHTIGHEFIPCQNCGEAFDSFGERIESMNLKRLEREYLC